MPVTLMTSSGPTSGTAIPAGRTITFAGRSREQAFFPMDRLIRPYSNATVWALQNIGKLGLELAYNQQQTNQKRFDNIQPNSVMIDSNGRPFVESDYAFKDYTSRVNILRATASYPFDFGKFGTQYVVLTGSTQKDRTFRNRWTLGNLAPLDAGVAGFNVRNSRIFVRAYLDVPNFGTDAFWEKLLPQNLPRTNGFRPDWYTTTSATTPFFETGWGKAYSLSSAGSYFNHRLTSILGVRYDIFDRKVLRTIPRDAIQQDIFLGYPDKAVEAYRFDPNSDLTNTSYSAGFSYHVGRGVNVYATNSTSFRWQNAQLFTSENPGPVLGDTREVGVKGSLFEQKLFVTLAAYRIDRENVAFIWGGGPTRAGLEDLFNPNNVLPGSPEFLEIASGLNFEDKTTRASERSEGYEATFQFKRMAGVQARFTFSHNEVTAKRDFSEFRTLLQAAEKRTSDALAAGGNRAMAENADDLRLAQQVLAANDGVPAITGSRSSPWGASWLLDYEFPSTSLLRGSRVALYGNWRADYNLNLLNGVTYRGGATHPVGGYAIHNRKIANRPVSFRLGVKNVVDLENWGDDYRLTDVIGRNPDGSTINLYRYLDVFAAEFSVTLDF